MTESSIPDTQAARAVLMVRPAVFFANPETASTNAFQKISLQGDRSEVLARTLEEFDNLVKQIKGVGVSVYIIDDTPNPPTPDAVFPNNWVSFHDDGTVVLYPMLVENRRNERRPDVIQAMLKAQGLACLRTVDLCSFELRGQFLEGTGSLVLDRINRIAYAGLSARTHPEVIEAFCEKLDYEAVTFQTQGPDGQAIYHTNVLMCVAEAFALVCAEVIEHQEERKNVLERLVQTGREVVLLSEAQLAAFAGNALELENSAGEHFLAMSERAKQSLTAVQKKTIEKHARILSSPINTIEDLGGGSVRCMLAAVHLPTTV